MSLKRALVVLLLGLGVQVQAADIGPELAKCRAVESLALRLQCYDALVDGLAASGVSTVLPEPVKPEAPVVSRPVPAVPNQPSVATSQPVTRTPVQTPAQASAAQPSGAPQIDAEDLFGKGAEDIQKTVSKNLEIEDLEQISSKVTQVRVAPNDELVVYLENDQVWRQKDKARKWRINVGETAVITKATLGSYLMKAEARKRSVRAERLR